MRAFYKSVEIWRLAGVGIGLRSRMLAFLCARFGTLAERRKKLRAGVFKLIGYFANHDQIRLRLRVASQPLTVFLREGNRADYLVLGEMVMGGYKIPANLSRRPSAVIDGGANIGMFSLFAHANFPAIKIICYEPEADNLVQLRKNLEINGIVAEVVPKALWSKTADLFFHPGESYTGFVSEKSSPYPISCVLPVLPDGCWLKLDIEGAEYEVLPALIAAGAAPQLISMEIHDFSRRGEDLLKQLRSRGYEWAESFEPSSQCVAVSALKRSN